MCCISNRLQKFAVCMILKVSVQALWRYTPSYPSSLLPLKYKPKICVVIFEVELDVRKFFACYINICHICTGAIEINLWREGCDNWSPYAWVFLFKILYLVNQIAGVYHWKHGRKGSGVFWLQQARDEFRLNRIAQQLFDFVGRSISDESFKVIIIEYYVIAPIFNEPPRFLFNVFTPCLIKLWNNLDICSVAAIFGRSTALKLEIDFILLSA